MAFELKQRNDNPSGVSIRKDIYTQLWPTHLLRLLKTLIDKKGGYILDRQRIVFNLFSECKLPLYEFLLLTPNDGYDFNHLQELSKDYQDNCLPKGQNDRSYFSFSNNDH